MWLWLSHASHHGLPEGNHPASLLLSKLTVFIPDPLILGLCWLLISAFSPSSFGQNVETSTSGLLNPTSSVRTPSSASFAVPIWDVVVSNPVLPVKPTSSSQGIWTTQATYSNKKDGVSLKQMIKLITGEGHSWEGILQLPRFWEIRSLLKKRG